MAGSISRDEAVAITDGVFAGAIALHERVRSHLGPTIVAALAMRDAITRGGRILVFGNGGSASDAQHFAAELVGRFMRERPAMGSIALTTDTSILTAISNDYSFRRVFVRQLEALGRSGDVAFGISTSGESPNVLDAIRYAREQGLLTIAMTGRDGGSIGAAAEIHVNVPDENTARVQEVHRTIMHAMCELIERE
ncbi:MAG TPA: SIS domain-containing protein [Vicinamibacterales bacterium]|nr:SIS domain-containing protein [Vicinamibacterales bacterium]